MKKRVIHTEACYLIGLLLLAVGAVFMQKADFGMSPVVAPAYLMYAALNRFRPFFTFGMGEYCTQAILLVLLAAALRRLRLRYLLSFATAFFYGLLLDGCGMLLAFVPAETLPVRILWYIAGTLLGSCGVAFLFHTYIAPEAYELFVKELADYTGRDIGMVKTAYDCASCVLCVAVSLLVMGKLVGVGIGTVVNALVNGVLIDFFGKHIEDRYTFTDGLRFRKLFEDQR